VKLISSEATRSTGFPTSDNSELRKIIQIIVFLLSKIPEERGLRDRGKT